MGSTPNPTNPPINNNKNNNRNPNLRGNPAFAKPVNIQNPVINNQPAAKSPAAAPNPAVTKVTEALQPPAASTPAIADPISADNNFGADQSTEAAHVANDTGVVHGDSEIDRAKDSLIKELAEIEAKEKEKQQIFPQVVYADETLMFDMLCGSI